LTILVLSPFFSFFLYCVLHEYADEASVTPCALQFYRGDERAVRGVVKGQLKILQNPVYKEEVFRFEEFLIREISIPV
jgi:hypothetical protein